MQTERVMNSPIPSVLLAAIYLYLLRLSWTPHTLDQMFASKYWLPEVKELESCMIRGCPFLGAPQAVTDLLSLDGQPMLPPFCW